MLAEDLNCEFADQILIRAQRYNDQAMRILEEDGLELSEDAVKSGLFRSFEICLADSQSDNNVEDYQILSLVMKAITLSIYSTDVPVWTDPKSLPPSPIASMIVLNHSN